jgi:hypothetical protein
MDVHGPVATQGNETGGNRRLTARILQFDSISGGETRGFLTVASLLIGPSLGRYEHLPIGEDPGGRVIVEKGTPGYEGTPKTKDLRAALSHWNRKGLDLTRPCPVEGRIAGVEFPGAPHCPVTRNRASDQRLHSARLLGELDRGARRDRECRCLSVVLGGEQSARPTRLQAVGYQLHAGSPDVDPEHAFVWKKNEGYHQNNSSDCDANGFDSPPNALIAKPHY